MDIHAISMGDVTALHTAAMNGHTSTVQTLIDADADVNAKTENDITPLNLARKNEHSEITRILVSAGGK